jgi:hypothetical protein
MANLLPEATDRHQGDVKATNAHTISHTFHLSIAWATVGKITVPEKPLPLTR